MNRKQYWLLKLKKNHLKMLKKTKNKKVQKFKIKTITYLNSLMIKSYFVLENLYPLNHKKKCKTLYYPSPSYGLLW